MADYDGGQYLVSRLGEDCNWVRNVRAAEGIVSIRHGRRRHCRLVEIPVPDRAPIIKRYLAEVPFGRLHIPVDRTALVPAFEVIADRYPVFRVESLGGGSPNRLYAAKRWMYRHGRPGRLAAFAHRVQVFLASRGVGLYHVVAMEVQGRRTGKLRTFPVVVADYQGERYVVAMLCEKKN
jgi:hypothetical protein